MLFEPRLEALDRCASGSPLAFGGATSEQRL
jgi:hypothetical protein